MKAVVIALGLLILVVLINFLHMNSTPEVIPAKESRYWFVLERKSGVEYLYKGTPGDVNDSQLVKKFQVKSGIAGKSPTPLPSLMGKKYWQIIKKESSADNPDTAPYFLTLDVPSGPGWPYGPTPYMECRDEITGELTQCDWVQPGYFGLHGTNNSPEKLSNENLGSFGCIRHRDEDIAYLYNIINPEKEPIRYYINDK